MQLTLERYGTLQIHDRYFSPYDSGGTSTYVGTYVLVPPEYALTISRTTRGRYNQTARAVSSQSSEFTDYIVEDAWVSGLWWGFRYRKEFKGRHSLLYGACSSQACLSNIIPLGALPYNHHY